MTKQRGSTLQALLVPNHGVLSILISTSQLKGLALPAQQMRRSRRARLSVPCTVRGPMYIKPYPYTVSSI